MLRQISIFAIIFDKIFAKAKIYVFHHALAVLSSLFCLGWPVWPTLAWPVSAGLYTVQYSCPKCHVPSCPRYPLVSCMSHQCCPATFVLSRQYCPICPVPATLSTSLLSPLSRLACPGCPVPLLHQLSCPRCSAPTVLSWLSCNGFLVPAVLSLLSYSGHPVLSFPSCPYYPNCFLWVSCPGFLVPAVLSEHFYPAVLSFPSCCYRRVPSVMSRMLCVKIKNRKKSFAKIRNELYFQFYFVVRIGSIDGEEKNSAYQKRNSAEFEN